MMSHNNLSLYRALSAVIPPADTPPETLAGPQDIALETPPISDDYQRAVQDILALLGLIMPDTQTASNDMAFLFIQSLKAHLRDDISVEPDWSRPDPKMDKPPGTARALLKTLEQSRARRCQTPTPLRIIESAQGIIKARRNNAPYYLMQYDREANQLQLVGGKIKTTDTSPSAALLRELHEELTGIPISGWDQITLRPVNQVFDAQTFSPTYGVISRYRFHLFMVEGLQIEGDLTEDIRWVHEEDITAGQTSEAHRISEVTVHSMLKHLRAAPYGHFYP
jgi:8-oxo-dGTP pyrophosphatase MutT (NUDIX family)